MVFALAKASNVYVRRLRTYVPACLYAKCDPTYVRMLITTAMLYVRM